MATLNATGRCKKGGKPLQTTVVSTTIISPRTAKYIRVTLLGLAPIAQWKRCKPLCRVNYMWFHRIVRGPTQQKQRKTGESHYSPVPPHFQSHFSQQQLWLNPPLMVQTHSSNPPTLQLKPLSCHCPVVVEAGGAQILQEILIAPELLLNTVLCILVTFLLLINRKTKCS